MQSLREKSLEFGFSCLVLLIPFNIFILRLGEPPFPYFDEVRYIPASLELLERGVNQNWSHPPLGKLLIGLSTLLLGDRPEGWRFLSAVFGALTVLASYFWGRALFRSRSAALQVAAIGLLNQLLFVQARIATLEIFMMAFIAGALALALPVWLGRAEKGHALRQFLAGTLLALATATKWFGVVASLAFLAASILLPQGPEPFRRRLARSALCYALVPVLAYLSVSLYYVGMKHPSYASPLAASTASAVFSSAVQAQALPSYGARDVLRMQWSMLQAQLRFQNSTHPYQSPWWSWPLGLRGMHLERRVFEVDGSRIEQSVRLIGNPVIMWVGFLCMGLCAWIGWKTRQTEALVVVGLYAAFLLSWALIPRQTAFYYYYFPAAMLLGPAIVLASEHFLVPFWARLAFFAAALGAFAFFLPLLWFSPVAAP